ncbi:hypothetical protein [Rhodopseudomonas palustris]|uniref:Uncharacterized protein n=1 Tax=Rhodopseudomonas palustris (strain DX-1) TaxID=652103 RepID=E6VE20_RHOPX|nr:hypothetical protein [Rhodopseudomonas palustris]
MTDETFHGGVKSPVKRDMDVRKRSSPPQQNGPPRERRAEAIE